MICPRRSGVVPAPKECARLRVLVIDDDHSMARFISRALRSDCEATEVTDGREALLRLAYGGSYDVILLDIQMPNMGGVEVYARLRAHSPSLAERVVVLTGGSMAEAQEQFLAEFPNEVLSKPFTVDELRRVVAHAGARRRAPIRLRVP